MKFAIRKLAMTCILPAALFQGALPTDVLAQVAPSAVSKANSGLPTRRVTSARTKPSPNPKASSEKAPPLSLAVPAPKPGTFAAGSQPANTTLVRQVTNGGPQQRPTNGGETDVQRQLRMLYEKSGQEMPAMTLEDLEVPEPQPGVQPGGPGQGDGEEGVMQPRPQYAQPAVPPQKAPNFFERVFLGKKMPPQAPPRPMPQRPQPYATGQMRPGQPAGAMPSNGARPNYQPYQPAQPMPGYNGQRPGMMGPQGTPVQPQGVVQQPARPNAQVQPPQLAPQLQLQQPVLQQPALQQPQVQPAPVPGNQAASGGVTTQPDKPASPAAANEIPLLEEEPEESLEIDLKPQSAGSSSATAVPTVTPGNVIPPAAPDATPVSPGQNLPQPDGAAGSAVEENPFSGLQLSIPESSGTSSNTPATNKPATPDLTTPSITPGVTINKSPAANAILPANPTLTAPAATTQAEEKDPFAEEPLAPSTKEPASQTTPTVNAKATIAPAKPAADTPLAKPAASATGNSSALPTTAKASSDDKEESKPAPDDNLKKLSEATEKDGLKGFCPVVLRQKRQLIEAKPQFKATYAGKKYHFSSNDAKTTFEKSPQLFAPAHATQDAVALLDDDKSLPGTLDYAAWYQGRLYLFANQQNLETFKADPEQYLDDEDSEDLSATLTSGTADKKVTPPATRTPAAQTAVAPAAQTTVQQPAKPANAKSPPAFDDLPVLSENLDDLQPIAPPATPPSVKTLPAKTPNVPKIIGPAKETPAKESSIKESPKSETPKAVTPKAVTPKPVVPKALAPQGPKLGAKAAPSMRQASGTALISMPPQMSAPAAAPRPISPDLLRIVPPKSALPGQ